LETAKFRAKKTVEFFDERYPGKMSELGSMLFGEKSFIMMNWNDGTME
jgi:hypothetical protein